MTQQIEAMKMALDLATRHHTDDGYAALRAKVRYAIKEALAQPEQEPVACIGTNGELIWLNKPRVIHNKPQPLYTTPPQRTWVGLTNDEVNNFAAGCHLGKSVQGAIYEAEVKLKEKNT